MSQSARRARRPQALLSIAANFVCQGRSVLLAGYAGKAVREAGLAVAPAPFGWSGIPRGMLARLGTTRVASAARLRWLRQCRGRGRELAAG